MEEKLPKLLTTWQFMSTVHVGDIEQYRIYRVIRTNIAETIAAILGYCSRLQFSISLVTIVDQFSLGMVS